MDENKSRSEFEKEALRLDFAFHNAVNFTDRVVRLDGDLEDDCDFGLIDFALSEMERTSRKAITVRLKSYGGSVSEALAILGRFKRSKCQIRVEGYGVIMSAATILLAGADIRSLSKFATVMHHQSSYGVHGKHDDITLTVKQMEKEERIWASWMAEFTKQDADFWYKKGKKDFYFTAEEALELGMIDEIF